MYVSTSTEYKNVEKKNEAWAAVADEVGCSGCTLITYLKFFELRPVSSTGSRHARL